MNRFKIYTVFLLLAACSSSPIKQAMQEDQVLSRIDNLKERPSWLKESERFKVEGGNVVVLGQTEIPATDRVDAAYRIAQSNAKAELSKAIEQKLSSVFQNAEEGTAVNANQVQYVATEASRLTTSSIKPGNVYWEKVLKSVDKDQQALRYIVFSTVTMPEGVA